MLSSNLIRGLSQSIRLQSRGQTSSSLSQRAKCIVSFKVHSCSISNPSCNTNPMNVRSFSSEPYHEVVGMPALSPTMEAGTIASWNVKEGDSFGAGDSIAEVETDKATMDFEAQDEGYVAKILVEAGGDEIKVGDPIMVIVDSEEDVAAFKDFVPPEAEQDSPEPVTKGSPPPPPVIEDKLIAPEPVVVAPAIPEPMPVVDVVPEMIAEVPAENAAMVSPGWGNFAKIKSPLASTLSTSQKKYVELYGSTGQTPI